MPVVQETVRIRVFLKSYYPPAKENTALKTIK